MSLQVEKVISVVAIFEQLLYKLPTLSFSLQWLPGNERDAREAPDPSEEKSEMFSFRQIIASDDIVNLTWCNLKQQNFSQ